MDSSSRQRAEARTALAMAGMAKAPLACGLTFVTCDALSMASRATSFAPAVADACRRFRLDFAFVPAAASDPIAAAEAVLAAGAAVMWVVDGPLGSTLDEIGWSEGLAATVSDPDGVAAVMERHLEAARASVEEGVRAGASVLVVAEDLASAAGPMVSPDFAFDEVFCRLASLVGTARASDLPCVWHSDGDVRAFLPAARRAGFTALHAGGGLGFEAFEKVFWACRSNGLAVLGGLLTRDLADGHLSAVAAGTRAGILTQAGGLLLSDDGGMTTAEEMALFVSAMQAARASSVAGS